MLTISSLTYCCSIMRFHRSLSSFDRHPSSSSNVWTVALFLKESLYFHAEKMKQDSHPQSVFLSLIFPLSLVGLLNRLFFSGLWYYYKMSEDGLCCSFSRLAVVAQNRFYDYHGLSYPTERFHIVTNYLVLTLIFC